MIAPASIFPTHSDLAVAVGCRGIFDNPASKTPTRFAIRVALDKTTDTMLVKIPWNSLTIPQVETLKETLVASPVSVCGVRFENLHIKYYEYTDPKTHHTKSGYTGTATNISEIIP